MPNKSCWEQWLPASTNRSAWLNGFGVFLFVFIRLTRLQVKLAEVLGGAEGDHHHAVPEDVLPCGHLESDLCVGDETVLLDHWVDRLHPAVPEVYPGVSKASRKIKSYNHKKQILKSQCEWNIVNFRLILYVLSHLKADANACKNAWLHMISDVHLKLSAILSTQKAAKTRPFGHTSCSGALSALPLNIQTTSVLTEFT